MFDHPSSSIEKKGGKWIGDGGVECWTLVFSKEL